MWRYVSFAYLVLLVGCSSSKYEVEIAEDYFYSVDGSEAVLQKAGSTIEIGHASYALFEAPGRASVLIPPRSADSGHVNLHLRPLAQETSLTAKAQNEQINEAVSAANQVGVLISRGQSKAALEQSESLVTKYPHIALFSFLRANCLLLLGEPERAKEALKRALELYPNDPQGLALQTSLNKGEKK